MKRQKGNYGCSSHNSGNTIQYGVRRIALEPGLLLGDPTDPKDHITQSHARCPRAPASSAPVVASQLYRRAAGDP